MSIIVAVLVFGLIVLIHEFGHFIVAKKCGIGVIEFSIGMGPRVWSFEKEDKEENKVKIDVNIIVEYGTRIPDVAFEIQNRVKTSVENMTGLKVEEVNVHVQGVNTNTVSKEETEQNEEEKEQAE